MNRFRSESRLGKFQVGTLLALSLTLSACSSTDESLGQQSQSEVSSNDQVGTGGQLIAIQSDNVRSASYDATTTVMIVQFDNGALYEYYGVEAALWTSFIAAQPHPWSQVGYPRLVQEGIPYKRIG